MVDVLFLNPPFLPKFSRSQRSPAVTRSGTLYYPMWLAYAAAWLEKHGFTVALIDCPADGMTEAQLKEKITAMLPRIVVIDTSTPSIYSDLKLGDLLKESFPETCVVMVGTHVSALPAECLKLGKHIDGVAVGEYENTILTLIRTLKDNKNPAEIEIPGFLARENAGSFQIKPFEKINELDQVPFVTKIYKKFLNPGNYFNPNALYPMVALVAGRGCKFRCSFCVYPQVFSGKGQRLRSVDNILEEFRYVTTEFPEVKAIFLEDDTFTGNPERCREFCARMIAEKIKLSWTANARAEVDPDTLKLMKQAGCRTLCVGFESGVQEILDTIGKKLTVERSIQFARDAKAAGLLVHGCFMYGAPRETRETMEKTLAFALSLDIDTAQFYPLMVYPGTHAYEWYREKGLLKSEDFSNWLSPEGLHNCVIRNTDLSSEDLVKFCDYSRRKFYLRPSYIFQKSFQILTHPSEFKRKWKSALALLPHLFGR